MYTVYRSDTDCHIKLRCGGALIYFSEADFGAKRGSDLEYFQEYVWMEITVTDGLSCLLAITNLPLIFRLIS
jgi:hypothetical protein